MSLKVKAPSYILQQFVDRAPQTRVLSFEMMSWSRWKAISDRFSVSPLPVLLDLRILAATKPGPATPDSAPFPPAINLRHLSVRISGSSALIWSHIAFPGLTGIRISFGSRQNPLAMPDRSVTTLGKLLDVLRSSPLLEDIHLVFGALVPEDGISHHPVLLLRLQKLFLSCNLTPVHLLTSITFPTACLDTNIPG